MKTERLVQHLADTARKIGYRVRSEEGNFRGGSCVLVEERLIIINRRMSMDERAELLGRVLVAQNLDGVFLLPEVRAFIEKFQPTPDLPLAPDPAEPVAPAEPVEPAPEPPAESPDEPPATDAP